jgi:hypothetical protein
MSCNTCGQQNCVCGASVLANVQLIDSVLDNPTINGGAQNSPVINDAEINGGTLDCNVTGCTAGPGQCNDGVATNAFVCAEVARQIDGSNPDFCQAVDDCLSANPAALCAVIAACINGTPGIINNTIAFGVAARATTALYGVAKYATSTQLASATCLVAIDPCSLAAFWNSPNLASPLWAAFQNAVDQASSAIFNNTILTGDPQAPTPPPGDCDNSIATTSFVCTAITNAISGGNPAFCAAVAACPAAGVTCAQVTGLFTAAGANPGAGIGFLGSDCMSYTAAQIVAAGGGGGGGGVTLRAKGVILMGDPGTPQFILVSFQFGCTISLVSFPFASVTFDVPFLDNNYQVILNFDQQADAEIGNKVAAGFGLTPTGQSGNVYFEIYQ